MDGYQCEACGSLRATVPVIVSLESLTKLVRDDGPFVVEPEVSHPGGLSLAVVVNNDGNWVASDLCDEYAIGLAATLNASPWLMREVVALRQRAETQQKALDAISDAVTNLDDPADAVARVFEVIEGLSKRATPTEPTVEVCE